MTRTDRLVSVGRVGRAHGLDGSFYVVNASHDLPEGASVTVGGVATRIERRAGTSDDPLIRVAGVDDRHRVRDLQGEPLLMSIRDAPLESDEWLAEDLVGCEVPGLGEVRRVIGGPSCDLLEVGADGILVPFISDAVKRVDLAARRIEVDLAFLAVDEDEARE